MNMTTEEAKEHAELTGHIVGNLNRIEELGYTEAYLNDLLEKSSAIAKNLQTIAEADE
jgi:hypothetical protein